MTDDEVEVGQRVGWHKYTPNSGQAPTYQKTYAGVIIDITHHEESEYEGDDEDGDPVYHEYEYIQIEVELDGDTEYWDSDDLFLWEENIIGVTKLATKDFKL